MTGAIIGISLGLLIILSTAFIKSLDRSAFYGLILSGIAFLYVGFTWTDLTAGVTSGLQVIFFVLFTYYGLKTNLYVLGIGYFLHGLWDMAYPYFLSSSLLPPQYDAFCISIDFVMGFYLVAVQYRSRNKLRLDFPSVFPDLRKER